MNSFELKARIQHIEAMIAKLKSTGKKTKVIIPKTLEKELRLLKSELLLRGSDGSEEE